MRSRTKKIMSVLVLLCLMTGALRALLLPKSVNSYENRPADRIPAFSLSAFADGSFQGGVEAALSDQLPFSQYFKKACLELNSLYLNTQLLPLQQRWPDLALRCGGLRLYRGYLLYERGSFETYREPLSQLMESWRRAMEANPSVVFTFYYIETDGGMDLLTGEKNPFYEELCRCLAGSGARTGRFRLDGFSDYARTFRRTDHHWNHVGSYEAYCQLLPLLDVEEDPLLPAEERIVDERYAGSKSFSAGMPRFCEPAAVYFFDYPELGASYGSEEAFRRGEETVFSYGDFYGTDRGELVFDTGRTERENLLVVGDSYDNAILKLLASHFNRTFCLDLRYKLLPEGEDRLDLTAYLRDHEIDRVLVIGGNYLYTSSDYRVR